MANISDAYGTISLVGNWTPEMCAELNIVKKHWETWYYDIVVNGDFTTVEPEQSFSASGRWTFSSTVESLDAWIRDDFAENEAVKKAYSALIAEMSARKCGLKFSYTDMESGFLVLYDKTDLLEVEEGKLTIAESSENNREYCWREYIECDYGGDSQFEELFDGLLERLDITDNISVEAEQRIENWLMVNTHPYADADSLEEKDFAKVRKLLTP